MELPRSRRSGGAIECIRVASVREDVDGNECEDSCLGRRVLTVCRGDPCGRSY
jgi:hypothetical protein